MKSILTVAVSFLFALPMPAQQSASSQQQVQEVECRDLASTGNYLAANETIINGKACRPAGAPLEVVDPAAKLAPAGLSTGRKPQAQSAAVAPIMTPAMASGPVPTAEPAPVVAPTPNNGVPKAVMLEDGTPVSLVLDENVSSADAVTGQTVAFEVVDDIVVDGLVIIPRGSTAWATVTDAQKKRRMGRAGHVDMNIDKVRLADGEKVLLRAVKNSQGGGNQGKMVGAMAATAIFTLGGSALFLLVHGKDTTIPKGTQLTAFVQGNDILDESRFQRQMVVAR